MIYVTEKASETLIDDSALLCCADIRVGRQGSALPRSNKSTVIWGFSNSDDLVSGIDQWLFVMSYAYFGRNM